MLKLATRVKLILDAVKYIGRSSKASGVITSVWEIDHIRNGKVIDHDVISNLITTQGLNFWNDVMFHGTTALATWYLELFSSNTTILATHTYAIPGYTPVTAKVDEATRVAFVEGASVAGVTTNTASKALYTFNDSETVYGAALVGGSTTKGDVADGTGILFAAALFGSPKTVVNDDILATTVTITLANA
jgi:hypothetical protein